MAKALTKDWVVFWFQNRSPFLTSAFLFQQPIFHLLSFHKMRVRLPQENKAPGVTVGYPGGVIK